MLKLRTLIVLSLCVASLCVHSQEPVWGVDFSSVIENREGGDKSHPDQTFLFTRLTPELGIALRDTTHRLMGGVSWHQPLNHNGRDAKVSPVLYYEYRSPKWSGAVGMIPRRGFNDLPRYLWSDSLSYYEPVLRGAVLQYAHRRGYLSSFVDWRQQQSEKRREAFTVLFAGRWASKALSDRNHWWLGGYLQYNHLAKHSGVHPEEGVNDDLTLNPLVGFSTRGECALWCGNGDCRVVDSPQVDVAVQAGAIFNFERDRLDDIWRKPCGFVADATLWWRRFELHQSVYAGDNIFPIYNTFGSELNLGDSYYCAKFYARTDLKAHLVSTEFVDLTASLSFHATDKITAFWQQVSCRFYFDRSMWGKGAKKH